MLDTIYAAIDISIHIIGLLRPIYPSGEFGKGACLPKVTRLIVSLMQYRSDLIFWYAKQGAIFRMKFPEISILNFHIFNPSSSILYASIYMAIPQGILICMGPGLRSPIIEHRNSIKGAFIDDLCHMVVRHPTKKSLISIFVITPYPLRTFLIELSLYIRNGGIF